MILIVGASGTIGQQLVPYLCSLGHTVKVLQRNTPVDLTGVDTVINLAGSPITKRWNQAVKEEILKSRIETTKRLVDAMQKRPPLLFISASAVGYYGNCNDMVVTENSPCGNGFLAEVCNLWEYEANRASCRVITLRLGMVLTPNGGALKMMLPAFRLGLGASLGSSNQWVSWISMRDLLACFTHCIKERALSGPVNAVSPFPVTNREFTKALAHALKRPAWFNAPSWLLRLGLGELADEMLLSSTKAVPTKLLDSGFHFQDETLQQAFEAMLKRTKDQQDKRTQTT